jgi:putative nucleotidyltransferase with HDIG domain
MLGIPVLPASASRILKVSATEYADDKDDMAQVISANRSLTGNILEIANSACFGLSQEVSGVSRAIEVLGYEAVKSIALSALLVETVNQNDENRRTFDRNRFWTHSLACAYLSKKIAAVTRRVEPEATFVCGLLHDIGKAFLASYFPGSYDHVLARLGAAPFTSSQAEYEALGFTHAEVGMWLTQRWRFPKAVVFTIANHHGLMAQDRRYNSLTATLRLADHLCLEERLSLEEDAHVAQLENTITDELKLNRDDLIALKDDLATGKSALSTLLSA